MYLNRIRPPKPKFTEEVTKAEFVPEEPIVKAPKTITSDDIAKEFNIPTDVLERVDPSGEMFDTFVKNMKPDFSALSYAELKKLAAERGIKTSGNPKKDELIDLLGGSDGQN